MLSRTKDKSDKEQAFNAMLLRNKALIWHICSDYNLGKVWNVEDCMQEVIVSLWRYFDTFEGRSSEQTWIYRVATNAMLLLRRKDNKNPATEQIDIHEEINDMPDAAQHDEDGYIAAVDHTNQTLWIFFYDNAEESATIMRHIRKDLLVFQNIQ